MQHALTRKEFLRWSLALATVVAGSEACSDSVKPDANEASGGSPPTDGASADAAGPSDGAAPRDVFAPADAQGDAEAKASDGSAGACKTDITLGNVEIDGNHGHSLLIPAIDLASTTDKTYPSMGGDHVHTLTINAASFAALRAGFPVMLESGSESGHSHGCWLRCAK